MLLNLQKTGLLPLGLFFRPPSQDQFLWPSERAYQESTVSDFVLTMIASENPEEIHHFKHHADLATLEIHDTFDKYGVFPLFLGDKVWMKGGDRLKEVGLIFPGSFNPPHEGHFAIAAESEKIIGKNCFYEISVENVYKAPVTVHEINDRLEQFFYDALGIRLKRKYKYSKIITKSGCAQLHYSGKNAKKILDWLYFDSNESIRMRRKYDRYRDFWPESKRLAEKQCPDAFSCSLFT